MTVLEQLLKRPEEVDVASEERHSFDAFAGIFSTMVNTLTPRIGVRQAQMSGETIHYDTASDVITNALRVTSLVEHERVAGSATIGVKGPFGHGVFAEATLVSVADFVRIDPSKHAGPRLSGRSNADSGARVHIAPDVEDWLKEHSMLESAMAMAELCVINIPGVLWVNASLSADADEETTTVVMRVQSNSTVAEVEAAEDRLHLALIERIPVADLERLSIAYEFNRR